MSIKNVTILVLIVAALSAALTRYYFPKVEMKTQEITKEVIRNDIRTIVKEVTRPDGSKEVITETTDKTVKREESKKETVVNIEINVGSPCWKLVNPACKYYCYFEIQSTLYVFMW